MLFMNKNTKSYSMTPAWQGFFPESITYKSLLSKPQRIDSLRQWETLEVKYLSPREDLSPIDAF